MTHLYRRPCAVRIGMADGTENLHGIKFMTARTPKENTRLRSDTLHLHEAFVKTFSRGQKCAFMGHTFLVPSSVYKPVDDISSTQILWKAACDVMDSRHPKSIIEIGAGSGAVSILLKKFYSEVALVATDISQVACAAIECNGLLHDVDIDSRCGDMWEVCAQNERFDFILFNVPLLDKSIEHKNEVALCDPDGQLLRRFLQGAQDHVTKSACILFLHATMSAPLPAIGGYDFHTVHEHTTESGEIIRAITCKVR